MSEPDIRAVNRSDQLAMLDTGELVPITNWFIGDGGDRPCEAEEADQAVAGPCPITGKWFRIDLSLFTEAPSAVAS